MFRRNYTTYLPLLLSGLPIFAVNWLKIAGIPTVPLQSTLLCREGKTAAGQLLIFDARNATGRMDARMARENGAETINVADLLPRDRPNPTGKGESSVRKYGSSQSLRATFLEELKLRIESAGGFWMRIADYPFPYQCALCQCDKPEEVQQEFAEVFAIENSRESSAESTLFLENSAGWIGEQYASGQPIFYNDSRPQSFGDEAGLHHITNGEEYPLMWHTTGDEFLEWTRLRAQIKLTAAKTGSTYHVQWTGNPGRFRSTVELWLGSHVASLPFTDNVMTLREEGILFVQEHRRHAAGVAAGWSNTSQRSHVWDCPAHHTV